MSDMHTASTLPPRSYSAGDQKVLPIVVYALYLGGFVSGFSTTILGVILAYVFKGEAGAVARSHYDFLIRTFWLSLAATIGFGLLMAVGALLAVVLIGIPIMGAAGLGFLAVSVWFAVRCIVGLIRAAEGEGYANPRSWMI